MAVAGLRHAEEDAAEIERRAFAAFLGHGADFRILFLDILVPAAADVLEDFAGLVEFVGRGEVAGGVWEHFDASEEEEGGEALEGEEEAPADGGVAVIEESEAEGDPVGDGDAKVVGDEDVAEEATSVFRRCYLGDEDGSDSGQSWDESMLCIRQAYFVS